MDDKELQLKQSRQSRGAKKGVLTRYSNQARDLINVQGSRRRLQKLLCMLGDALNDVHVTNEEYTCLLNTDREREDAEMYMADVDDIHRSAADVICQYLQSRLNEPPSEAGSMPSSASTAASKAADVNVKVKQLKVTQLERRLNQEKEEQELHRRRKLQEARDEAEAAALEASLMVTTLDTERCHDFDDEPDVQPTPRRPVMPSGGFQEYQLPRPLSPRPVPRMNRHPFQLTSPQPAPPGVFHNLQTLPSRPAPRQNPSPFQRSLPKIKLPIFSGDAVEWPRWLSLFQALIHEQPNLTDVEKMTHLQSAVSGPPQKLIAGMMYSGRLYNDAMQALKERYGKEDDIVHACLCNIFDHSPLKLHDVTPLESFMAQ